MSPMAKLCATRVEVGEWRCRVYNKLDESDFKVTRPEIYFGNYFYSCVSVELERRLSDWLFLMSALRRSCISRS